MNWRDIKIDDMHKELDELRFVSEYPREFLLAYFKNLKQKIETIITQKSSSSAQTKPTIYLTDKKESLIDRIKQFEFECLSSVSLYNKQIVSPDTLNLIQAKLDSLSRCYILNDNFKEQVKEIDCLVYDELYRLQKYLFRGKTLVYLEKKLNNYSDDCFVYYDRKMKLILVNEFFGKKGLEIIK